jgi:hypothetical protein
MWMLKNGLPKCANPACSRPSYCAGSGKFFLLEILSARDDAADFGSDLRSDLTPQNTPRLRIDEYWLCARCSGVYTLVYDDDARMVYGVKLRPAASESALESEQVEKFLLTT